MIKGTPSPTKKSIFDSELKSNKFWNQLDSSYFVSANPTIENVFYYRTYKFFNDHVLGIFSIIDSFLVFQKKKSEKIVEYINLDENMYQLEIIGKLDKRYSSKHKYAFALSANGKSFEFYCKYQAQFQNWLVKLRKWCIMTNFNDVYKIGNILGAGGYGKVYLLEEHATKAKWAGKFIKISQTKNIKRQITMIINEIKILRKLNHPNIVKLHEVYEINGEICMVMEYLQGEKFFNHIVTSKKLSEPETALIMKQLFFALHHLQKYDVVHRDIKPENIILIKTKDNKLQTKLIDFGLGTFHNKGDIIKKCGTPGYVAPEILNYGTYDFSVDIYSLGIVMMVALTGKPAFHSTCYKELLEKNAKGLLRTKGRYWTALSEEDLDPPSRMSIEEALNHKWFRLNLSKDEFNDILSHDLRPVKKQIPKEGKIAPVPLSSKRLFSSRKCASGSFFDSLSVVPSNISQSFITSHYQINKSSALTLNSFYKGGSKESSFSDINTGSMISLNINPSPKNSTWNAIQNKPFVKENALGLPNKKPNHKTAEGKRRSISLNVAVANELSSLNQNGEVYKIQISAIDSLQEMSFSSDDSTCGKKYLNLPKNKFSVRKIRNEVTISKP